MSLSVALNNAVSGLKAVQSSISVVSQNIANANTPGYSKQEVNLVPAYAGSDPAGVKIASITRAMDGFLQRIVRERGSEVEAAEIITQYISQLQNVIGEPGSEATIAGDIDNFMQAVQVLETNPEKIDARQAVIDSADAVARGFTRLAYEAEVLRFQADRDISTAIDDINSLLDQLHETNISVNAGLALGRPIAGLQDEQDRLTNQIAQYLNVNTIQQTSGEIHLYTANGIPLLEYSRYYLDYQEFNSVSSIINNAPAGAITVNPLKGIGASFNLTTAGVESASTTVIKAGKMKGLLDLRDRILPSFLEEVDQLAFQFSTQFNAIHNDGGGFPGLEEMLGTKEITSDEVNLWSGQVMIGLVDIDGKPLPARYSSDASGDYKFRPLTLDLGALDAGDGAGKLSVSAIMNEINTHFGAAQKRAVVGELVGTEREVLLNDVRIVSMQDEIDYGTVGDVFEFDFELENIFGQDVDFSIQGINVTGGGVITANTALPTSSYTSLSGTKARTNIPVELDMSAATGAAFTVEVTVRVDNGTPPPIDATFSYIIDPTQTDLINKRYYVDSTTTPTYSAVESPSTTQTYLRAKIVDANGNDTVSGEAGFLKLEVMADDGTNPYYVVINELTSSEGGLVPETGTAEAATNRGFSHYFGLNNFFVETETAVNSAYLMEVREDIKQDVMKITTGRLFESNAPTDDDVESYYTYEMAIGNNFAAADMTNLINEVFSFSAAGKIPQVNLTISGYAANLIAIEATRARGLQADFTQKQTLYDSFATKLESAVGVNVDEELAKTVIFQTAYAASARVITVTEELFDILIQAMI